MAKKTHDVGRSIECSIDRFLPERLAWDYQFHQDQALTAVHFEDLYHAPTAVKHHRVDPRQEFIFVTPVGLGLDNTGCAVG